MNNEANYQRNSGTCGCRFANLLKATGKQIAFAAVVGICLFTHKAMAQEPKPGTPKPVKVPAVSESKLRNGLTVAVVERKGVPIVTVQLLVRGGSASEGMEKAGLANVTAEMLTKGTKTRSATQISEDIGFLGASLGAFAQWNNSRVAIQGTSDKIDAAMAIMADVVLNPTFTQEELDLQIGQAIDGLSASLSQPGFLANYLISKYSFGEHPSGGTPESLKAISRDDVVRLHANTFKPQGSVLIFAGDISAQKALELANKHFGGWTGAAEKNLVNRAPAANSGEGEIRRFLVIDMPDSGQASVNYAKPVTAIGRGSRGFYTATVLNSVLGGGYSSRMNLEIRIKRGLSYGAFSSFAWRESLANFAASTQTKNESAAEVAELIMIEIRRLKNEAIAAGELEPRKAVLTGGFGRTLETNGGLARSLAELYAFGLPTTELNAYMSNVNSVNEKQVMDFAGANLLGGDMVIVGDYAKFKDDLAKRFPNRRFEVVKVDELDITKPNLRK